MSTQRKGPDSPKWKTRPLCACGCGTRVKRPHNRWVAGHVPKAVRVAAAKKGRAAYAFKKRSAKYRQIIDRVLGGRRAITRDDLFEICEQVGRGRFQAGWSSAIWHVNGRKPFPPRKVA